MKYKIKISRKIKEVNTSKWDEIAKICFLNSQTLFSIENLSLGKEVYYIEILNNDELISIAVFYSQQDSLDSLYSSLEESLYGNFTSFLKPFIGLNPSLMCYFPYAPYYKMFEIKDGYNKQKVFNILSLTLKIIAKSKGYKSYGFIGIDDKDFIKENSSDLIPIFSGFKARIEVKGKDFCDHINNLDKCSHRNTLKNDIRSLKKIPFKIEKIKKLGKYQEEIINIFNQNFEKHSKNQCNKEHITEDYIKTLEEFSDKITYFVGKIHDKIVSASMIIEDNKNLFALRIGKLENEGGGASFFKLAIHQPIMYAIENSKKYVELGTGNYEYKTRRGATLRNYYNFIDSTSKIKSFYLQYILELLNKRNIKKHTLRAQGGKLR